MHAQWKLLSHTNRFLPNCKPGEHQLDEVHCGQATEESPTIDDEVIQKTLVAKVTECETHPSAACLCTVAGDHCHLRDYNLDLSGFVKGDKDLTAGAHNTNYSFVVTVTNRAGLIETKTLTVQVDGTPPIAGAVNDSAFGVPDHDYQQNSELKASFSGFSDPDSGIRAYFYRWSDRCLAEPEQFDLLDMSTFTRTESHTAKWTAPGPGFYVVTVRFIPFPSSYSSLGGFAVLVYFLLIERMHRMRARITGNSCSIAEWLFRLVGLTASGYRLAKRAGCSYQTHIKS